MGFTSLWNYGDSNTLTISVGMESDVEDRNAISMADPVVSSVKKNKIWVVLRVSWGGGASGRDRPERDLTDDGEQVHGLLISSSQGRCYRRTRKRNVGTSISGLSSIYTVAMKVAGAGTRVFKLLDRVYSMPESGKKCHLGSQEVDLVMEA
ncbi:hypothetical protein L1887_29855 [Cichorium endivia]|nr:hypothetical protein L1887_29855 [Cichorium endivia]